LLGGEPGSILEVGVDDIFTTHALVHSRAVPLGTTLKTGYVCFPEEIPPDLCILLIEVKEFTQQLSPEVGQAVDVVVERIKAMVGEKIVVE
jgi:hydrogenase maturation protease